MLGVRRRAKVGETLVKLRESGGVGKEGVRLRRGGRRVSGDDSAGVGLHNAVDR